MAESQYEHGLPADPSMAGFGAALDPDTFGHHLGERLDRAGLDVRRCELDRFRYRHDERLVVVYRVEAGVRPTGATETLVVAGRIHAGRPVCHEQSERADGIGRPRVIGLPGLGMRVEIFPEDRRLPHLRAVIDEPCSPRSLDLLRAAAGWSPAHSEEIDVEVVRYRPGIAATIRYSPRAALDNGGSRPCYFKFAAGSAVAEFRPAANVNRAFERAALPLRLSVPDATDVRIGIDAYSAASGRSLHQLARDDDTCALDSRAAGRALADMHLVRDADVPLASGSRELRKYERAGRMLAWACPEARPAIREIERCAPMLWHNGISGVMHGDMKPDHLFIDSDSGAVEFIDNEAVAMGNPLLDIGSMLARLDAMPWLEGIDAQRTREIGDRISAAYLDRVPAGWARHLGAARALATLLVCQHAVQRLAPGWQGRVAGELEAAACLA